MTTDSNQQIEGSLPDTAPSAGPLNDAVETGRFREKRNNILDAATVLVNKHGINGMTIVDVAKMVNLNTTSITYYFKKKEDLANAVLERSLGHFKEMVDEAGREATPRDRIKKFIENNIDRLAMIDRGEAPPYAYLSDVRAISEPYRTALSAQYVTAFQALRDYFGPINSERDKAIANARTHVFLENMFWLPAWIKRYAIQDYDRLKIRLFEIFDKGIAPQGSSFSPSLNLNIQHPMPEDNYSDMAKKFLRAATTLINERGFRGASVKRITEHLSVTKGSFYHHLDAKNDLVLDCFQYSYNRVSSIQKNSLSLEGNQWQQLCVIFCSLLDIQLLGEFPFLRTTALQALPSEIRPRVIDRSNRIARRFAGILIDGISENTVRTVDPLIASQCIMAMLNSAYELRGWASNLEPDEAIYLYGSTIAFGLFDDL